VEIGESTSQQRTLASVAVAGPVVFALCWVVSGLLQEGYRLVRDDESSLAASGASHPWITMAGDPIVGVSIVALSIALARMLTGRRYTTGCILLAVAGVAVVVQALVREDCVDDLGFCTPGSADSTWHQPIHDIASAIAFFALIAAMFVLVRPFSDRGWVRLARWSRRIGAAGVVLLVVFIALSDSSAGGIAELAFVVVPLGWVMLVGLVVSDRVQGGEQQVAHTA
jgi:hypothetical membrane protein